MLAELIDGTTNSDLCRIVALILIAALCVMRLYYKVYDSVVTAAVWFFLVLWLLLVT